MNLLKATGFSLLFLILTGDAIAQDDQEIIRTLQKEAHELSQKYGSVHKADSLNIAAIKMAEASLDPMMIFEALMEFLTRDKYGRGTIIPDKYLEKAEVIGNNIENSDKKISLWIALSNAYIKKGNAEKAQLYSDKALSYAASTDEPGLKARAYIISGKSDLAAGLIEESWSNFLRAENFITMIRGDDKVHLMRKLKEETCQFYTNINSYDRALKIKQELLKELATDEEIDSLNYMWTLFHLCDLATNVQEDILIDEKIENLLQYSRKNNNKLLEAYILALYREHLINNLNLDEFYDQFHDYYDQPIAEPGQYHKQTEYCLSNALLCEFKNQLDSAHDFYHKAIHAARLSDNEIRLANTHRRYGQFLMRHGLKDEAKIHLDSALILARDNNYEDFILEIAPILENMASSNENYADAYHYSQMYSQIKEERENKKFSEKLLVMELQNKKKLHLEELQQKMEEQRQKVNMQYLAIGLGIIVLFILMVIISSLPVPAWFVSMLSFFNILFIFEFVILLLDNQIHHWAHGEPILIFLVKVAILSILFPLHHVIERSLTDHLVKHNLIRAPRLANIKKFLKRLYPWLNNKKHPNHQTAGESEP